ncbi:MAG: APC family permease [Microbacterium ginsengisoli]|jgi:amino acid transporter|uniref:APC family permease n=2 Tax=Microbacteriaceae TaxID=85023 RepID=UPI0007017AF5|nr:MULTISPECIES: APC family permease [unclassified Microbacterium]KQR94023.1 amino acid permease [Microbacterium sp. Leaf347]MBN9198333.1 APC family permease [Microbacterium ginsengisoli]OJU78245.1 MAG: amino acid permease [Microbacterium sp. 71-23]
MSATPPPGRTAAHRRLGVPAVAFMIVAASAPLTVIAGGSTSAFSVTHVVGIPFGYIVLAVFLAVFAVGYAAMSRYVTDAGAFYSYIAQGLGRPAGVGSSILALISYNAMQIGVYGMFGFQVSTLIEAKTGWASPWWVWVLVCIAIVALMGVNRVDLSAKILGVLVALEFVVVIVFDVAAFFNPAEGTVTASPITPSTLFVPGVGAVLAFGIAAFMGFESAAIYGEESKDPKRTIPRATFLAVAVIGIFYALSSWALALAVGPGKILDPNGITADEAGPPLFFNFVAAHLGTLWVDLMSVLFITSLFASLVSFHNAVARYAFSLGREGVLPSAVGRVRRHSGAPWVGSVTQTVVAVLVILGFVFGESGWDPNNGPYPVITLFTWLTNLGAFGLVLLMALVSLAVIGFFRRDRRDAGLWSRVVAPVLSFVALGYVWVLILMNWDVLLGQTESTPTTFLLPAVLLVPAVLAVFWALWLRRARPDVYRRIGHGADAPAAVHLGEETVGV